MESLLQFPLDLRNTVLRFEGIATKSDSPFVLIRLNHGGDGSFDLDSDKSQMPLEILHIKPAPPTEI